MTDKIESSANPKYKQWLSLTTKKGIKQSGHYLLSGKKLISEFIKESPEKIFTSLSSDENSTLPKLNILSKKLLQNLSPNKTAEDILVVKSPVIKTWTLSEPIPNKCLFIPLGDPANLGAILRSAVAFGIQNIILLEEACHPLLPKAVKAASGAVEKLNLFFGPSIKELSVIAPKIYALDKSGKVINSKEIYFPLLIGEEGIGIPDFKFKKISIPMNLALESLNANVAASILLYENFKKEK